MGRLEYKFGNADVDPPEIVESGSEVLTQSWQYTTTLAMNSHTQAVFLVQYTGGSEVAALVVPDENEFAYVEFTMELSNVSGSSATFYRPPNRNPFAGSDPEVFKVPFQEASDVTRFLYKYKENPNEKWAFIRIGYRLSPMLASIGITPGEVSVKGVAY